MNFFEYLSSRINCTIGSLVTYDEAGNAYIGEAYMHHLDPLTQFFGGDGFRYTGILPQEQAKQLNEFTIIRDDDCDCPEWVRRPYFRMRGKPVTEAQAFDIIRRTDRFFGCVEQICGHEEYLGSYNFDNWLINTNHYPEGYGWIHTDGTVGVNSITQRYPTEEEVVLEWLDKLAAFPYLDLVIVITWWNELPSEVWDVDYDYKKGMDDPQNAWREKYWETTTYCDWSKEFTDAVRFGICIHDKTVEVMNRHNAVKRYQEYVERYGNSDCEVYLSEYYDDKKIRQVNLSYLKRCIEAYGLNADEVLKAYDIRYRKGYYPME